MVAKNPKLKEEPSMEDPPMLGWPERVHSEPEADAASPDELTAVKPRVADVKICALSILCMLTALLSFLFFPALAALALGIFALRQIDESKGKLSGRHLAITGLCISATALAFWLALFVAGWIAWKILGWIF